jgi:hypothetical protein
MLGTLPAQQSTPAAKAARREGDAHGLLGSRVRLSAVTKGFPEDTRVMVKNTLVAMPLVMAAVTMGCGSDRGQERSAIESTELLSDATTQRVLGFESSSDWSVFQGPGTLGTSSTGTQGMQSLVLTNPTYTILQSARLSTLGNVGNTVRVDYELPAAGVPWGALALTLDAPSVGMTNTWIGQVTVSGVAGGTFQTASFTLPSNIVTKLASSYGDLAIRLTWNVPASAGAFLVDNVRFVGGPNSTTEWPNANSKANSDPWLVANHAQIQSLNPRVLALFFDNGMGTGDAATLTSQIMNLFQVGSRPHGYSNSQAQPLLNYQLEKIVDMRDKNPPPSPRTSSLWPRRPNPAGFNWGTDYAKFFTDPTLAARYGYPDPAHAGQYLSLCQLADQGIIHDVWLVSFPDSGVTGAEVLEWSPTYDAQRKRIAGGWNQCAGNGCFDSDVPHCAGSLRIGFVGTNVAAGNYVHSAGHGMECKFGNRDGNSNVIAYLTPYFRAFADFDLDARYGAFDTVKLTPMSNWYGLPGQNPDPPGPTYPCDYIHWVNPNTSTQAVAYTNTDNVPNGCTDPPDRHTLNNYVPVCGSVHFPVNARRHYDQFNTTTVLSTCEGYRRKEGAGGTDLARPFSNANFLPYQSLPGSDPWLVWWIQSMPGVGSEITDNAGQPMPSWLPFLFY